MAELGLWNLINPGFSESKSLCEWVLISPVGILSVFLYEVCCERALFLIHLLTYLLK